MLSGSVLAPVRKAQRAAMRNSRKGYQTSDFLQQRSSLFLSMKVGSELCFLLVLFIFEKDEDEVEEEDEDDEMKNGFPTVSEWCEQEKPAIEKLEEEEDSDDLDFDMF